MVKDVQWAACAKEIDAEAVARGQKLTVDQRKDAIFLTPKYQEAHRAWLDAVEAGEIAESAKYATIRKHDHVTQLTGLLAQELAAKRGPEVGYPTTPALGRKQPVTGR